MILHIPFISNVHLRSILLKLGRGEYTPTRMRIYANYPNIVDFSEARDLVPQLDIRLSTEMEGVTIYPINRASPAFTSINSLSIFFVRFLSCSLFQCLAKGILMTCVMLWRV